MTEWITLADDDRPLKTSYGYIEVSMDCDASHEDIITVMVDIRNALPKHLGLDQEFQSDCGLDFKEYEYVVVCSDFMFKTEPCDEDGLIITTCRFAVSVHFYGEPSDFDESYGIICLNVHDKCLKVETENDWWTIDILKIDVTSSNIHHFNMEEEFEGLHDYITVENSKNFGDHGVFGNSPFAKSIARLKVSEPVYDQKEKGLMTSNTNQCLVANDSFDLRCLKELVGLSNNPCWATSWMTLTERMSRSQDVDKETINFADLPTEIRHIIANQCHNANLLDMQRRHETMRHSIPNGEEFREWFEVFDAIQKLLSGAQYCTHFDLSWQWFNNMERLCRKYDLRRIFRATMGISPSEQLDDVTFAKYIFAPLLELNAHNCTWSTTGLLAGWMLGKTERVLSGNYIENGVNAIKRICHSKTYDTTFAEFIFESDVTTETCMFDFRHSLSRMLWCDTPLVMKAMLQRSFEKLLRKFMSKKSGSDFESESELHTIDPLGLTRLIVGCCWFGETALVERPEFCLDLIFDHYDRYMKTHSSGDFQLHKYWEAFVINQPFGEVTGLFEEQSGIFNIPEAFYRGFFQRVLARSLDSGAIWTAMNCFRQLLDFELSSENSIKHHELCSLNETLRSNRDVDLVEFEYMKLNNTAERYNIREEITGHIIYMHSEQDNKSKHNLCPVCFGGSSDTFCNLVCINKHLIDPEQQAVITSLREKFNQFP